jgi:murein DD-endopeptidase MepM/ murein hydrolase activator NlpD
MGAAADARFHLSPFLFGALIDEAHARDPRGGPRSRAGRDQAVRAVREVSLRRSRAARLANLTNLAGKRLACFAVAFLSAGAAAAPPPSAPDAPDAAQRVTAGEVVRDRPAGLPPSPSRSEQDAGGAEAPDGATADPSSDGGLEPDGYVDASLGEGVAVLRPARLRPGDLFEVLIAGPFPAKEVSIRVEDERFSLFATEPGQLRGFGAIPAYATTGRLRVELQVGTGPKALAAGLEIEIELRQTESTTLKVDPRFTRPSKQERARIAADAKAIVLAYRVPFGPPRFSSKFADPRDGAPRNSRFGERRVFNGALKSRHMGLDLDGKVGDPVRASNDGVVRLVRDCFSSGNTVLVSHGAGLFTGYFHLSKLLVKNGQRVKKGELVGLLGRTGRVTGPHLHFAAKLEGTTFDPEGLLGFEFFSPKGEPAKSTPGR